MQQVGLWHITADGPRKLGSSSIELEQHLEDWIEKDPALLEAGLRIVGRQVVLEAGKLDLLALDPQGAWVVIELKRSTLYRDVLAQALDYAACIAAMPLDQLAAKVKAYVAAHPAGAGGAPDDVVQGALEDTTAQDGRREVRTYLVGTGWDRGLERLVDYLSGTYGVPVSIVTFDVFEVGSGERVLVRELTESDMPPPVNLPGFSVDLVCAQADSHNVGESFRRILRAATEHGLYPHPYKASIKYAAPTNHARSLFTVWSQPTSLGQLGAWIGPESFSKSYPVKEDEVTACLGPGGWRKLTPAEVGPFVEGLHRLFAHIEAPGQGSGMTAAAESDDGYRSEALR